MRRLSSTRLSDVDFMDMRFTTDAVARIKANLSITSKDDLVIECRHIVISRAGYHWLWMCEYDRGSYTNQVADGDERAYIDRHFDRWMADERPKLLLALL